MELTWDNDMILAKRLSTISLKEPRSSAKNTESLGKTLTSRESRRMKRKNGIGKKETRTESCLFLEKNCETISYRICGNPEGEGFLIEARMYKGNEGKHDKRKRERQAVYTVYIHDK